MKGIHIGELAAVGKLFFMLLLCGGLLAFNESKIWAVVALVLCMFFMF